MSNFIYNSVHPYLELGKSISSPQMYLSVGHPAYWMSHATLSALSPDAGILSAENVEAMVQECCSAEQQQILNSQHHVDFIIDSPAGKHHLYLYKQDTGTLIIALSLNVNAYLKQGVECGASDVHLPSHSQPTWRLHGSLAPMWEGAPRFTKEDSKILADSFLTEKEWETINKRGDVDFAYQNEFARYRASVISQRLGYDMTYRVINTRIYSMEELKLPTEHIIPLTRYTNGLILVTGAVGTGKSTTLASIVDFINSDRKDHIITLEDPIETIISSRKCHVHQREVRKHTASFPRALRAALREDPDVIVVGEMRDLETISLALTAAETGHLVLGTLHTASAARTIDRILDAFPIEEQDHIRIMVGESLRCVLSQQLIPTKDGKGRAMAMEMLVNTAAIANCIREGKTFMIPGLIQTGKAQGMRLMDDAIQQLYLQGEITADEALFRASEPTTMEIFLKNNKVA